jgi:hypothetical protein
MAGQVSGELSPGAAPARGAQPHSGKFWASLVALDGGMSEPEGDAGAGCPGRLRGGWVSRRPSGMITLSSEAPCAWVGDRRSPLVDRDLASRRRGHSSGSETRPAATGGLAAWPADRVALWFNC